MRFVFIEAQKVHYPVRILCHVMQVSHSGFYAPGASALSARVASRTGSC